MIPLKSLLFPASKGQILRLLVLAALLNSPVAFAAESLEALVNRANVAAEKQDYATAIRLYEQAHRQAPAEKTLKKNLAVLYANYSVSLQEQKKYDEALQTIEKGAALVEPGTRDARSIQEAKASVYFSQAIDLKDKTESPTATDYERMRALLGQAITLSPNEVAFKKAMAGVYMDQAYQLALQEHFEDARPLLEKALEYDSQSKSVRQSLANVYLGLARNDVAKREEWITKALATEKLRAKSTQSAGKDGANGFASSLGGNMSVPKELSQLSVSDMLRDMEAQLELTPAKGASLQDRLEILEKQVLGKTQNGALAARTKTVYVALMGSYTGSLDQSNPRLVQAPAGSSETSYLDEIFKVTDGKVIRWGKFPVRIYFETPKDNPLFKPEYKAAALEGFKVWKDRTDGFINFVEIKNPDAADIQVIWTDKYEDRFISADEAPSVYKNYTPPKRNPLMTVAQVASMFTPGYFSLAPQAAAAAMQYQQQKKLEVIREESKIKLGLGPVKDASPEAAKWLIHNMAAKEFGHALGLKGSSPKEGDLLYPALRSDAPQFPTQRDLTTLRELYNRPPNIILNVR
jgi:hypothetical protein